MFLGLYDDNKYVNEMKEKHAEPAKPDPADDAWAKLCEKFGEPRVREAYEQNFPNGPYTKETLRSLWTALDAASKIEGEPANG